MPKEDGNLAEAYRWLPNARCKDLSLGAGAHSCARGALVDPVSYGQQSTTEGSWRDVKKEVEEMKDRTQRSAGSASNSCSDLK